VRRGRPGREARREVVQRLLDAREALEVRAAAIMRCLSIDPTDRPSAAELASALDFA